MRRSAVVLAMALVIMGFGATTHPAVSAEAYAIHGVVRDELGNVLEGVTVRSGGQVTATDSNGAYRLPQTTIGTMTLRASRGDLASESTTLTVIVPQDTGVDFDMLYRPDVHLSPRFLNPEDGPGRVAVEVTTTAPAPADPSGSCVSVTEPSGVGAAATLASRVGGVATWVHELDVAGDSPEGVYNVMAVVTRCDDHAKPLSIASQSQYVVDNTAPLVADPSPIGWANPEPTLSVSVLDQWPVADTSRFLLDGQPTPSHLVDGRLVSEPEVLPSGPHTAMAVVSDLAGNVTVLTFDFVVDDAPPAFTTPSPTGETDDNTPLISIGIDDVDAGLDIGSIELTLSDGVSSHQLDAHYVDGRVSYQVPETPEGLRAGERPLTPGNYQISAAVHDSAGNAASISWHFTVVHPPQPAESIIHQILPSAEQGRPVY